MEQAELDEVAKSLVQPLEPIPSKIYEHQKTKRKYQVIGFAKHSGHMGTYVLYQALYNNPHGQFFIRPLRVIPEDPEKAWMEPWQNPETKSWGPRYIQVTNV